MISTPQEKYLDLPSNSRATYILDLIDVACFQLDEDNNFLYGNKKAELLFQLEMTEVIGLNVWDLFDRNICSEAYHAIQKAVAEQTASVTEYFCRTTEIWVSLHAIPSENGVVLMFTEITGITIVKLQLLEEQRRLKLAQKMGNIGYFEGSPGTASLYLSDELYRILGYLAKETPLNLELLFSHFHPEDRLLTRNIFEKQLKEQCAFEHSCRMITVQGETKVVNIRMEFSFDMATGRTRFYGVIQDITVQHMTQVELKESKELIESIFDASLLGISLLKPVRNPSGEIIDFQIEMLSRELLKESGRDDLLGKLCLVEFPGVKISGLFNLMLKVMDTAEPQQTEFYYNYDGFNDWFSIMFVKMEDALVLTSMNISNRRLAAQEQSKNLMILQQSEELAKTGSWEYDLSSEAFNWSEGMYRLFNLDKEVVPVPEIYVQYATSKYLTTAERMIGRLKAGLEGFEETIEILVNDEPKVLKLKASIHRDENGKPLKVLGVDIDMTVQLALSRKNEILQREIFRAVLGTQQEERKRIAESLHNGLGQLLYGVKLSLSKNKVNHANLGTAEHLKDFQHTENLLADAIRESRRLSHELMPSVLDDFGLKAALDDICDQFQLAILIRTVYTGLENKLDKFIDTAIYRVVQELMMNVVKHAEATKVTLTININEEVIYIQVLDNGKGFDQEQVLNTGIGLKAIRNKANLLNGCLAINSVLGKGAAVSVLIPNVPS